MKDTHITVEQVRNSSSVLKENSYVSGRVRDQINQGRAEMREARERATSSVEAARAFAAKIGLSMKNR
jgi:hypothetical protein